MASEVTASASPDHASARVLLFGGTMEGRELAVALADADADVTVCVATEVGARFLPEGDDRIAVRVGRLDESEIEQLIADGFDWVVDATHPYATEVSDNARCAAAVCGLPYLRVARPASDLEGCIVAMSVADAVSKVRRPGNVLATTGSKEIAAYTLLADFKERLYVRVLDDEQAVATCLEAGIPDSHIIAEQGPFTLERNLELIDMLGIKTLVTKDGGVAGGYPEKLEAARTRGIDLIVVARPSTDEGLSTEEALRAIIR